MVGGCTHTQRGAGVWPPSPCGTPPPSAAARPPADPRYHLSHSRPLPRPRPRPRAHKHSWLRPPGKRPGLLPTPLFWPLCQKAIGLEETPALASVPQPVPPPPSPLLHHRDTGRGIPVRRETAAPHRCRDSKSRGAQLPAMPPARARATRRSRRRLGRLRTRRRVAGLCGRVPGRTLTLPPATLPQRGPHPHQTPRRRRRR